MGLNARGFNNSGRCRIGIFIALLGETALVLKPIGDALVAPRSGDEMR